MAGRGTSGGVRTGIQSTAAFTAIAPPRFPTHRPAGVQRPTGVSQMPGGDNPDPRGLDRGFARGTRGGARTGAVDYPSLQATYYPRGELDDGALKLQVRAAG